MDWTTISSHWAILSIYFIVAFLVILYGVQVFDRCPMEKEELEKLGGGKSTAIAAGVMNILGLLLIIYVIVKIGNYSSGPYNMLLSAIGGAKCEKIAGYITIVVLLIALILTVISEFASVETSSTCKLITAQTQEQIDDFRSASDNLNRMYGIVVIFMICGLLGSASMVKDKVMGTSVVKYIKKLY
jgi:hypothetical protein